MPAFSLSRLPTVAALCGAALFGWSLGGIAAVDRDLQAVAPVPRHQEHHGHLVLDRDSGRHERRGHDEL